MFDIKKKIIKDMRVELLDAFDQNFVRKAFFNKSWTERRYPGGRGTLMQVSGRGRNSIRGTAMPNGVRFTSDTPYMGLHNRGGKVKITPQMRKYFWAMYYKAAGKVTYSVKKRTANNTQRNHNLSEQAQFWRAMALTKKKYITMPKRQVVGDHPKVHRIVREVAHQTMSAAFAELAKALQKGVK